MKLFRYVSAFLLFTLLSTSLFAQGIDFQKQVWEDALKKAEKQDKLVFVDCYTTWCGPCKKMDKNVFPQDKVGDLYNKEFVNVKLDMEKGVGKKVRKKYSVNSFPTYLFVDPEGNIVHRAGGSMAVEDFIQTGQTAADPSKNIGGMRQKYETGERSAEFVKDYLSALKEARMTERYKQVRTSYFESVSEEKLLTEQDFSILVGGNHIFQRKAPPSTDIMRFIVRHRDKYLDMVGEEKYNDAVLGGMQLLFTDLLTNKGKEEFEQAMKNIEADAPELAEQAKQYALIRYYTRNGEHYKMKQLCVNYIENYLAESPNEADYYFRKVATGDEVNDEALYSKAANLAEKALAKDPKHEYRLRDYYACLLYKAGKKKKAKEEARLAKEDKPDDARRGLISTKIVLKND